LPGNSPHAQLCVLALSDVCRLRLGGTISSGFQDGAALLMIGKHINAFSALLFGCGVLVLVVGLFTDSYGWQYGVIGTVAFWVIALALRAFMATFELPAACHHGDEMIRRYLTAIGAFVFGCGILVLVVGLLSDAYSWQHGLIGMVALWVADLAGAAYYLTPPD
jgi:uncharacterized membrane protein YqjE